MCKPTCTLTQSIDQHCADVLWFNDMYVIVALYFVLPTANLTVHVYFKKLEKSIAHLILCQYMYNVDEFLASAIYITNGCILR